MKLPPIQLGLGFSGSLFSPLKLRTIQLGLGFSVPH
jgi:hypothetical protein